MMKRYDLEKEKELVCYLNQKMDLYDRRMLHGLKKKNETLITVVVLCAM